MIKLLIALRMVRNSNMVLHKRFFLTQNNRCNKHLNKMLLMALVTWILSCCVFYCFILLLSLCRAIRYVKDNNASIHGTPFLSCYFELPERVSGEYCY